MTLVHDAPARRRSAAAVVFSVVLLLVAVAVVAYRAGTHDRAGSWTETGDVYVGVAVAGGRVDGWGYGFTPAAVPWIDPEGVTHEGSAAPCLRVTGRTVRIQFGVSQVDLPDGGSQRVVGWVRCLP